jgi:16S rRNA (uracil1498-N3)-methyltransferase
VGTPRIFTSQPLAAGLEVELEEGPSRHLAGALRLGAGAAVTLFDGTGGEYAATISALARKRVQVAIGEFRAVERESPLETELGIAVSRGERMDWVVQKSTELGAAAISPLNTERTEVRLQGERAGKKLHHWRQIAVSACEQCGRNRLPAIAELQTLADWLQHVEADLKLVLHHRCAQPLPLQSKPRRVALLIGPEGGLSDAEIALAEAAGFAALSLGPRVLRTETAPVAALSILQHHWGDMNRE